MINSQNGEDYKTFFNNLNLDRIAHLCKVQPDQPLSEEKINKILGRITEKEL